MKTAVRRVLLALLTVVLVLIVAAAPFFLLTPRAPALPPDVDSAEKLDAYFQAMVGNETPPAIGVSVVKNGAVVYSRAFGMADGPAGKAATEDTVYHFWSTTKLVTAAAVMQLVEEGKIGLDDPLTRHLPDFATELNGTPTPVTIRQILNHTAGVKDLGPTHLVGWIHRLADPAVSQPALVRERMQSYRRLATAPGSTTAYSNAGYIILGAVIEAASGMTYEDFIRQRILAPLGMTDSDFVYRDDMLARAAAGSHPLFHFFTPLLLAIHLDWFSNWVARTEHQRMWLVPLHTDYTPSTGLLGTVRDLARFGQAMISGGELDGQRILKPESAALLLDAGVGEGRSDGGRLGYGWHWWEAAPVPYKGHGGGGPGFAAQIAVFQDRDMVIALLANDTLIDRHGLINLVAGVFR